jgi:RNA polymerase sigma-70 factor (ECF subfamily)
MSHQSLPTNDARTREYLKLLAQQGPRLRGFILSLVPNWADAEDIAQEVKLRLWEQFDNYDPAKDFGAWACTIARYQVLTYREKQSPSRQRISLEALELVAKDSAAMSEALEAGRRALADCFEKLPEAKRKLLINYYSGNYSMRELAAKLGQTFDATRHTIVRTRIALKKCVKKTLHQEDRT